MRKVVLLFAAIAPIVAVALYRFGVISALAPIFVSHLLILYAGLVPNSSWWGPIARCFATTEREVWLTIDDGPSPAHTLQILDLLDRYSARATFFVIGARAEKYPHLITEIIIRGHELANHTFTHPSHRFWASGPRATAAEIDRCASQLRSAPDRPARFFRAPAGLKNPFLHPTLRQRNLQLIGWTARGLDTVLRNPQRVAARISRRVRPGAIILLHEGHRATSAPAFNLECIESTLRELTAAEYRFVIPQPPQLRVTGDGR